MNYPLDVGGVDDYPVKVGSMLMTLVDPSKGYEQAYNRWYERDHFYAGCMIGPWLFAGSRWVAPRELKDRRWPKDGGTVAAPYDAGSFIAIYWVEKGHHEDHFEAWAVPQVRDLYANGRGFAERRHVHTSLFDHIGSLYRDDDPVPIDLASIAATPVWWCCGGSARRGPRDRICTGQRASTPGRCWPVRPSRSPHHGRPRPPTRGREMSPWTWAPRPGDQTDWFSSSSSTATFGRCSSRFAPTPMPLRQ